MPPILESLGIDRMSVHDRIALANATWESVASEFHPPLSAETRKQVVDRQVAHPTGPGPWE